MKKFILAAFALLTFLSVGSTDAAAQKVAVVDAQKALAEYPASQDAEKKLNAMIQTWNDSLKLMQEGLTAKADAYKKVFDTMSKDKQTEAQNEVNDLLKKVQDYQNSKFNQQNGQILTERAKLLEPIVAKIREVITAVAKKEKAGVVIAKENLIYVDDNVLDLTPKVIAELKK
jgi:outer membrane protein